MAIRRVVAAASIPTRRRRLEKTNRPPHQHVDDIVSSRSVGVCASYLGTLIPGKV